MAAIINITGRLARDPETKQAGNSSVTEFSIPVDTGWKEGEKFTTWWRVSVWGKRGETAQQHVRKGSVIQVWGEACVREYQKGDGATGYSPEIRNAGWDFTPKQQQDGQSQGGGNYGGNRAPAPTSSGYQPGNYEDSGIPF